MTDQSLQDLQRALLDKPHLSASSDIAIPPENLGDDAFDLGPKIGPIYDIIRNRDSVTPLSIAIYGPWGVGKTSAMRWLDGRLAVWTTFLETGKVAGLEGEMPEPPTGGIRIRTTWFYPWKYQEREDVWRGLIAEVILASLKCKSVRDIKREAKALTGFLGRGFLTLLSGVKLKVGPKGAESTVDLNTILKGLRSETRAYLHPEADYLNEFETALKSWIKNSFGKDERLVVFIDDLDRCLPEVALRVLEALKLYLDIPKLVFVIGVDADAINKLVEKHYEPIHSEPDSESNAKQNYLAKMFHTEVTLDPSDDQIENFLRSTLKDNTLWRDFDDTEREIFEQVLLRLAGRSPREVKRQVESSLIAGAGVRFLLKTDLADAVTPAQIIRDRLVFVILKERHTFGSLPGSHHGYRFLRDWSQVIREHPDEPRFLENIKAITSRPTADLIDQAIAMEVAVEESNLEQIPNVYHALLHKPEYHRFLPVMQDEDLGELMRIPYPARTLPGEPPKSGRKPELAASRAIIEEAIAQHLGRPSEAINDDARYNTTTVDLSGSDVVNLSPLVGLRNLYSLYLYETQVSDLTPLASLKSLVILRLDRTQVSDVTPLANLENLTHLYLHDTQVSDVTPLASLKKLVSLQLYNTLVTDLTPLANLKNLSVLRLSTIGYTTPVGKQPTNAQIESLRASLPNLQIQ